MEKKYRNKRVLVYDHGSLVSLALRLAEDFGHVDYYYPGSKADYSKTSELCIGDGFEEIRWIENFWDAVRNTRPDLVVFPGVRDGDLQEQLVDMGIPVWGSREAECMEVYRWDFLEFQKKIGMAVPKSTHPKGMTALRKELYKDDKKKWVKLDANERGNIETFPYLEKEATELSILIPLQNDLGSAAEIVEFIVQEPIEAIMEDGCDPFTVDGLFPGKTTYGFESKDAGWIGKIVDYNDLPEGIRKINELLVPALKKYKYRGNISTEVKEGVDGESYLLDLTCRHPYPPTNCIMDNWLNMGECMYEGAQGNMVQPIYDQMFMCEVILYSDYAAEHDYKLIVPPGLEPFVKRPYCYRSKVTGSIITVPQSTKNTNVGSVISKASSKESALKLCLERAQAITGHGLRFDEHCLDESMEKL